MDKQGFERLYMEMLPGLYRLAQSILHHTADAQDAVQQAAMKSYLALERIRPGNEKAYVARVVINECRNIQRARMRVYPMNVIPERPTPKRDTQLAEAIACLPETLRLPLLLHYMEGYSTKEAALALSLTVSGLKARLMRARRRLSELLNEEVELG